MDRRADRRVKWALMGHVSHSLRFSLRADAEGSLDEMRLLVEPALGCVFTPDTVQHDRFFFKAELLGMRILLGEWQGLAGRRTFQLHGAALAIPNAPTDIEYDDLDINLAIIELLAARGAGQWRVPSHAEIQAEVAYAAARVAAAEADAPDDRDP